MIQLRRARERHNLRSGGQNLWLTFYPGQGTDELANGFGDLAALNEGFVMPEGNVLTYARRGSKTITYVVAGLMSQRGLLPRRGRSLPGALVRAGEFQCSHTELCERSIYANASARDSLHVLQLSLRARPELPPKQRPWSFAGLGRAGRACLVGSADGRDGSLNLGQDAQLYLIRLGAAQHVRYPLTQHRIAWLQVLHGRTTVNGLELCAGDGAGFSLVSGLALDTTEDAEIVLLELDGRRPVNTLRRSPADDTSPRDVPRRCIEASPERRLELATGAGRHGSGAVAS